MVNHRVKNSIIALFIIASLIALSILIIKAKNPKCDGVIQEEKPVVEEPVEESSVEDQEESTISQVKVEREVSKQITIEPIKIIEKEEKTVTHPTISREEPQEQTCENTKTLYTASQFKYLGVIKWNGWRWTWYSERVLPGGGLTIPGRHLDEQGYVCDENDYICLASMNLEKGTVIDTPFGKQGKVYDYCETNGTVDVYVGW